MDIQKLVSLGINYDEGLKRFAGKTELYEKYILKFLDDTAFEELQQAMKEKDYELAFKCAHTLKGVAGNLSFTYLYNAMCEFVEYLRNDADIDKAIATFPSVAEKYVTLIAAIKESM